MPERGETRVRALSRFGASFADCDTLGGVHELLVDGAVDVLAADAAIACVDDDGEFVPLAVHTNRPTTSPLLDSDNGIAGRTVRDDRTLVVTDLNEESMVTNSAFRSVVSTPLDDGVFQVFSEDADAFTQADRDTVEHLALLATRATHRIQRTAKLDRERQRATALFDNLPDPALSYIGRDGVPIIDDVNQAFVSTFGYTLAAAIDRPVTDVLVPGSENSPPEDTTRPSDRDTLIDREVERQTADGRRTFLLRRVPVDADDQRGYFIYTDVTELKRREERFERQNARLERFASVVAHDLRNPLNVAVGFLDSIDGNERAVSRIGDAHRRMADVIEDVLTLAQQGEQVVERTPVPLADAARYAWRNVATDRAAIDITATGHVYADESRLYRLLENLFRNCVEHGATKGQSPVHVEVGTSDQGFYVADDGSGIPPDERASVLESGYSSVDAGTGLGLAIVTEIADDHGWQVRVGESDRGGARFDILTGEDSRAA